MLFRWRVQFGVAQKKRAKLAPVALPMNAAATLLPRDLVQPPGGMMAVAPPAAVYMFAPDRKAERPVAHLQHFKGVLHVDGYAGFEHLTAKGDIVLAACRAHARRKFYDVAQATGSPVATEALR